MLVAAAATSHGTPNYFLATATVIPLLLIAYLFQVDAQGAINKMLTLKERDAVFLVLAVFGWLMIFVALAGAVGGEAASLLALFHEAPTDTEVSWTVFGIIAIPAAGLVNTIIAALNRAAAGADSGD